MKRPYFKIIFAIAVTVVLLQSCANDDDAQDTTVVDTPVVTNATTQLITDWNDLWLDLDRYTDAMRPNSTARALAYIHLAGYETAVADMDGYTSNEDRLQGFTINENQREDNVDVDLALNTCYALVFDHFMFSVSNNEKAAIAILQESMASELSTDLSESEIENSIEWGTYVAERVIAYSQSDTDAETQILDPNPASYIAPVGDGLWIAAEGESAWFPYWNSVRTFVISPDETTSIPPAYDYSTDTTSEYYIAMEEVNDIATVAREEDNEDLWIAEFWSDDVESLMMSPPGRQFSIANQLIAQEDLEYAQTLELLLRLGFAINDAAVSAWDDKYTYDTQRPSTYIRANMNADFDTNLSLFIDSPNPAFPSYPSGHATFAGVSAGVFAQFFGGDAIGFTDRSHDGRVEFNGNPRTYSSFSEMAQENAYSRVPLGVHVQIDSDEGIRLGYEISDAVNDFDLTN
ncbi:vanadium-dependent haloperoxidase [Dokdonia pacifica]|nr:vanadium-dependent haloperoxidase [Dokdonia pacifica]